MSYDRDRDSGVGNALEVAALALAVMAFFTLMATSRPFRWMVFSVVGVVGTWIWIDNLIDNHRLAVSKTLIPLSEIDIRDLRMKHEFPPDFDIRGNVVNLSKQYDITGLTLRIRAYDCPVRAMSPDCVGIGDTTMNFKVDVPAGQMRWLTGSGRFEDMPTPRIFVWDFEKVEVTAAVK